MKFTRNSAPPPHKRNRRHTIENKWGSSTYLSFIDSTYSCRSGDCTQREADADLPLDSLDAANNLNYSTNKSTLDATTPALL